MPPPLLLHPVCPVRCLSPKADKASLLSEAVKRLILLTEKCHALETEMALFRGTAPPSPPVPNSNQSNSSTHPHLNNPTRPQMSLPSPCPNCIHLLHTPC